MLLDLRHINFYIINRFDHYRQRAIIKDQLDALGLNYRFVQAPNMEPTWISQTLARLKILDHLRAELPLAILYDTVAFRRPFRYRYQLPDAADALYLGQSKTGIPDGLPFEVYDEQLIRLVDNDSAHAVVYLSEEYREQTIKIAKQSLLNWEGPDPGKLLSARMLRDHFVLSPITNPCVRAVTGDPGVTGSKSGLYAIEKTANFTDLSAANRPHSTGSLYDVFIHANHKRVTAIVPAAKDGHLPDTCLTVGRFSVRGRHLGAEVAGNDFTMVDFEHPSLEALLERSAYLDVELSVDGERTRCMLEKLRPAYRDAIGLLVESGAEGWLKHYLRYYLELLQADHIYLYVREGEKADALHELILPYVQQSKLTLIPWPFHREDSSWQVHLLNKYNQTGWVGFIPVHAFLHTGGRTLQEFLSNFDARQMATLLLPSKRFCYKGKRDLDEIQNPLRSFIYGKKEDNTLDETGFFISSHFAQQPPWELQDHRVAVEVTEGMVHCYSHNEQDFAAGKSEIGKIDRSLAWLYESFGHCTELERHVDRILRGSTSAGPDRSQQQHFFRLLTTLPACRILLLGQYSRGIVDDLRAGEELAGAIINPNDLGLNGAVSGSKNLKLLRQDWQEVDTLLLNRYNVLICLGETDFTVIDKFYRHLDLTSLLIVDNWNTRGVRGAVDQAISELGLSIGFRREISTHFPKDEQWGNGMGILGIVRQIPA